MTQYHQAIIIIIVLLSLHTQYHHSSPPQAYPYTAVTGKKCLYDGKPVAKVAAVVNITAKDEDELFQAARMQQR